MTPAGRGRRRGGGAARIRATAGGERRRSSIGEVGDANGGGSARWRAASGDVLDSSEAERQGTDARKTGPSDSQLERVQNGGETELPWGSCTGRARASLRQRTEDRAAGLLLVFVRGSRAMHCYSEARRGDGGRGLGRLRALRLQGALVGKN